jgi:poly-gamma-glutamate capsule biosynthesis protein CapA/YwtB (metallophosphatase superfamily)
MRQEKCIKLQEVKNTGNLFFYMKKIRISCSVVSICAIIAFVTGFPGKLLSGSHKEDQGSSSVHTIFAVGDIMLSGSAQPLFRTNGYDYSFKDKTLAKLTSSADVAFGNLEYPITRSNNKFKDKKYTFRGTSESLEAIRKAGFNLLSIANNHIMDYGEQGLRDTIRQCKKRKLTIAGAGADLAAASEYAVLEKDGVKYGLLAYSCTFPEDFWATPDKAGTAHPDWAQVEWDITNAKKNVDILIVSFHWGEELKSDPKKYQVDYAHHAINSGADMVLGHHPHVPQGIEMYKGKPIFYSLGNYAFGTFSNNVEFSFAASIRFEDMVPVQITLYPLNVYNQHVAFRPRLAKGSSADSIIMHLRDISKPFGTSIDCKGGIGKIVVTPYRPEPPAAIPANTEATILQSQE